MTAERAPSPALDRGLRVRLLGGFDVWLDGRPVALAAWRRRKSRAVVKLLALAPGHWLHREQVIEALWPGLPVRDGANNLHYVMHLARRTFAAGRIPAASQIELRILDGVVTLAHPAGVHVDATDFENAARGALGSADASALEAAAALYVGELLPDDRYEDWSAAPRERLRDLYLALLLELAECYERARRPALAIAALLRAIAADPLHDAAHTALVRLYAASGRRADARRHFQQLAELLDSEYHAEPPAELRRLVAALERPTLRQPAPLDRHPAVPAPLTRFVGRERELALLARALRRARLVTLTGTGGTGKTRLALEGVARVAGQYVGGLWISELAPVAPGEVAAAVAAALGAQDDGTWPLHDVLRRRLGAVAGPALLVLDNCEHALEGCVALTAALLPHCPALTILATSRRPLGVLGETVLRVPPLSLPTEGAGPAASPHVLRDSEAVQLFEDRARLSAPAFRLTAETAPGVAQIVRRLDGLPLAIELAAARAVALPVSEIASWLDEDSGAGRGSLTLLNSGNAGSPARHRSLRTLFDWTCDTLAPRERSLFRRLSIFAGGFTLDAATAICAEGEDAAHSLAELVEHSLVTIVPQTGDAFRYTLLETLRVYALALLESEETDDARRLLHRRHAAYFGEYAAQLEARSEAAGVDASAALLARDLDNCRAALHWAVQQGEPEIGLRLARELSRYWHARGNPAEGFAWFDSLLDSADGRGLDRALHLDALRCAASLARVVSRLPVARRYQERYCESLREHGDPTALAGACLWLSVIAHTQGDSDAARAAMEECLRLAEGSSHEGLLVAILRHRANLAVAEGRPDEAASLAEQCLPYFRLRGDYEGEGSVLCQLGNLSLWRRDFAAARRQLQGSMALCHQGLHQRGTAAVLLHLGWLDFTQGDRRRGVARLRQALSLSRDLGLRNVFLECVERLGAIAFNGGRPERAALLLGAAETLRAEFPGTLPVSPNPIDLHPPTREQLAAEGWASAWRTAATLPLDRVAALALSP